MTAATTPSATETVKADVKVFFSPTCPHCPPAKDLVRTVASDRDDIMFEEINIMTPMGLQMARRFEIMSTPTILIKGPADPQWIGIKGVPRRAALEKAIDVSLGVADGTGTRSEKGFLGRLLSRFSGTGDSDDGDDDDGNGTR
ncbi:thioredoxin family protein [Candidatus Woesearchaeota archaeon]|nr:thioredoxin family protein [Candidatus Woesearchaeota archaeon]